MSDDSGEEFGGLAPTTPHISQAQRAQSTTKKPTSRTVAGPSKVPAAAGGRGKKRGVPSDDEGDQNVEPADDPPPPVKRGRPPKGAKKQTRPAAKASEPPSSEPEEDPQVLQSNRATTNVDDDDDEEVEEIVARGGRSKKGAPTSQPARANARGRPKGKAPPNARGTPVAAAAEVSDGEDEVIAMEVDNNLRTSSLADAINLASGVDAPPRTAGRHKGKENAPRTQARDTGRSNDDEVRKLRAMLEEQDKIIQDLKQQLEDLHRVRTTEPEKLMEQMAQQHESESQAKDAVIEQLTQRLSAKDSVFRSHKAKFELFTREEVDRETEKMREEVKKYKAQVQEVENVKKEREEALKEMLQIEKELRFELNHERDARQAAEARALKVPASVSKSKGSSILRADDPKNVTLIRFYEDLTNFLVPSLKIQPGPFLGVDEAVLRCIYTYNDPTNPTSAQGSRTLQFQLRLFEDAKDKTSGKAPTRTDELVASVHYQPIGLDQEDPAFVESLDFLKTDFTFERTQLALFVRTMYDYISGEKDGDSDAE